MRILARSPSNIAWIKYMGKRGDGRNLPENPSLSLTLNALCTWVEVERGARAATTGEGHRFEWSPDAPRIPPELNSVPSSPGGGVVKTALSAPARDRILHQMERVVLMAPQFFERFRKLGPFRAMREDDVLSLRSQNTFPMGAGIASSASSFSAVTAAVLASLAEDPVAFEKQFASDPQVRAEAAHLSRLGSGSSCRSFFGPLCEWENTSSLPVEGLSWAAQQWEHWVLVLDSGEKAISSSEAHQRVKTSSSWEGRPARAQDRLLELRAWLDVARKSALRPVAATEGAQLDFRQIAPLVWDETMDMHQLFHTSRPPFFYIGAKTWHWLREIHASSLQRECPALVTLDAGPNIHLTLWKRDAVKWQRLLKEISEAHEGQNKDLVGAPDAGVGMKDQGSEGVRILKDVPGAGTQVFIRNGTALEAVLPRDGSGPNEGSRSGQTDGSY